MAVPAPEARWVLVGRYSEDGPVDISRTVAKGEYGAVRVRTQDLERVIDEALGFKQPARGPSRAVIDSAMHRRCEVAPDEEQDDGKDMGR